MISQNKQNIDYMEL